MVVVRRRTEEQAQVWLTVSRGVHDRRDSEDRARTPDNAVEGRIQITQNFGRHRCSKFGQFGADFGCFRDPTSKFRLIWVFFVFDLKNDYKIVKNLEKISMATYNLDTVILVISDVFFHWVLE
jgi:hypothetical protein